MPETINDRIEILIKNYFNDNKASFAKSIDMPPTGLSNYLGKQRRSKPSVDMIVKIIQKLRVDPFWLLLGEKQDSAINTEGNFSPTSVNGNVSVFKDVVVKDDNDANLKSLNEKLTLEVEMLKKLLEEKERLIKFLTSK